MHNSNRRWLQNLQPPAPPIIPHFASRHPLHPHYQIYKIGTLISIFRWHIIAKLTYEVVLVSTLLMRFSSCSLIQITKIPQVISQMKSTLLIKIPGRICWFALHDLPIKVVSDHCIKLHRAAILRKSSRLNCRYVTLLSKQKNTSNQFQDFKCTTSPDQRDINNFDHLTTHQLHFLGFVSPLCRG